MAELGLANLHRSVLETVSRQLYWRRIAVTKDDFILLVFQNSQLSGSIDTDPRESTGVLVGYQRSTSAREHTDTVSPLKYLDSLVHLYKPAKPLGLAALALRNGILQFQGPTIGQRVKM